jgi:hypothetical protein
VPEIAICQNGEIPTTGNAFLMTPRNSAPSTAPADRPRTPGDGDPADHAGRHDVQLEPARDVHIGHRIARDP